MGFKISEQLKDVHDQISKIQVECNANNWTVDLESAMIAIEGYIAVIEWYESQEEDGG